MTILSERVDSYSPSRVLITGLPGSGKSTLAAQLSKTHKLLWFDLENSEDLLKKFPLEMKQNINYIPIPDSASYPIASETLLKLFKLGRGNICETHARFDCVLCMTQKQPMNQINFDSLGPNDIVVIDSITQLSASILSHVTKDEPVEAKPERDDWGALRKYTEFFCSQFQGARFNLIAISHLGDIKGADGKEKLGPNFGSKSMSASIGKAFGHMIYTEVLNGNHIAGSSSKFSARVLTKSRTDFIIENLVTPNLLPVFDTSAVLEYKVDKNTGTIGIESGSGVGGSGDKTPATNAQASLKALMSKM